MKKENSHKRRNTLKYDVPERQTQHIKAVINCVWDTIECKKSAYVNVICSIHTTGVKCLLEGNNMRKHLGHSHYF